MASLNSIVKLCHGLLYLDTLGLLLKHEGPDILEVLLCVLVRSNNSPGKVERHMFECLFRIGLGQMLINYRLRSWSMLGHQIL